MAKKKTSTAKKSSTSEVVVNQVPETIQNEGKKIPESSDTTGNKIKLSDPKAFDNPEMDKRVSKALKNEEFPETTTVLSDLPIDNNQITESVEVSDVKEGKSLKEEEPKELTEKDIDKLNKRSMKAIEEENIEVDKPEVGSEVNEKMLVKGESKQRMGDKTRELKFEAPDSIEAPDGAKRTFNEKFQRFHNKYNMNPTVLYADTITLDAHHYRQPAMDNGLTIKEVHGADRKMVLAYE